MRKVWIPADVFVSIPEIRGEADKLDLTPLFRSDFPSSLIQSLAKLERNNNIILHQSEDSIYNINQ